MSLEEFWDNITKPGFLSATFDEFSELCDEIKEDAQQLAEESEELLSHGLNNMFKDTSDFQTTVEQRESAYSELKVLHEELLEARGLDDHWSEVVRVAVRQLESIIRTVAASNEEENTPDYDLESISADLKHIVIKTSDEIATIVDKLQTIMAAPGTPTYHAPEENDNVVRFGPVGIFTSDKEKRKEATNSYLEEVGICKKEVQNEIVTLQEKGKLFDGSVLLQEEEQLLISFCQYSEQLRPSRYSTIFGSLAFLGRCGQCGNDEDLNDKETHVLDNPLLHAAGIYILLEAAVGMKQRIGKEQYLDLQKLAGLLSDHIDEKKRQEVEFAEDFSEAEQVVDCG